MANEWRQTTLGEILTLQRGHDLPSQKRSTGEIPIISSSGITDYHSEAAARGPGVITGRYGTIGEVFYVEGDYWPLNTTLYVKNFKGNSPKFIYYLLKTIDFHQFNDKSSVPGVNRNHAHTASVTLPPLHIQGQIAAILSAFDDKIELNSQMNRTLEQMARALFKSWFVDFDPLRAKMRGEEPEGMDAETAALFPDELVRVDGQEVPRGWDIVTLDSVSTYLNRGIAPKYVETEGIAVVNQKCIRDFQIDLSKARLHSSTSSFLEDKRVKKEDVLVNSTGVGTLGRLAQVLVLDGELTVDTHVTIIRPDLKKVTPSFFGVQLESAQAKIESMGVGSTGQTELGRGILGSLEFLLPDRTTMEAFEMAIRPMRITLAHLQAESAHLAHLRDSFLPRLLSGEVDVSDWVNGDAS